MNGKRDFLMLAKVYDPKKHLVGGWYMSEKLDGLRAFWDGGISRGLAAREVPWANVEKHTRFKDTQYATGLWTRYAQPIQAPDWFLDALPSGIPADGELTLGRGAFQDTVSAVKKLTPIDSEWMKMKYMIFDSPPLRQVFMDGKINCPNMYKILSNVEAWVLHRSNGAWNVPRLPFYRMVGILKEIPLTGPLEILEQTELPASIPAADKILSVKFNQILDLKGEGLMLRSPISMWEPTRTNNLLKMKPINDMEGTVVGYTWGEETDKGSKLLGLMGSLRLRIESGVIFDLSGFTDAERRLWTVTGHNFDEARNFGMAYPGEEVPTTKFENPLFPVGSRVTFKYRELSRDGVPKDGRYLRRREDI